jgi:hypothetical protein
MTAYARVVEIDAEQREAGSAGTLSFAYINYRCETSDRRVRPLSIRFGTSHGHKQPQWLMTALDLDKNELREFAMEEMYEVDGDMPIGLVNAVGLTAAPAAPAPIPQGVYHSSERANFYDSVTNIGMGMAFWCKWRDRWNEFPQQAFGARRRYGAWGSF